VLLAWLASVLLCYAIAGVAVWVVVRAPRVIPRIACALLLVIPVACLRELGGGVGDGALRDAQRQALRHVGLIVTIVSHERQPLPTAEEIERVWEPGVMSVEPARLPLLVFWAQPRAGRLQINERAAGIGVWEMQDPSSVVYCYAERPSGMWGRHPALCADGRVRYLDERELNLMAHARPGTSEESSPKR